MEKFFRYLLIFLLVAIATPGFTRVLFKLAHPTIYQTSIDWHDKNKKLTLLAAAPEWDNAVINKVFQDYLHPEKFRLPELIDEKKYNVQFINAFWGPLNNPFNKYERPAKIFIFLHRKHYPSYIYYLAPLIRNSADKNYYIFTQNQSTPTLLSDWIFQLQASHPNDIHIRINLCSSYGNLPQDVCSEMTYETETAYTINQANQHLQNTSFTHSAYRPLHVSWHQQAIRYSKLHAITPDSILESNIAWNIKDKRNALLNTVNAWPNLNIIRDNFEKIRDIRYFSDAQQKNFPRRISWLYPDDGCWTRAAAAIKDLFGPLKNRFNNFSRPSKIFVFGDLCVNTDNSKNKAVSWWYHTAPIIQDARTKQIYILDPAVNPYKPLTLRAWITEITSETGACAKSESHIESFNICNGYATTPNDSCRGKYQNEIRSVLTQSIFQKYERDRQTELGRDANAVLGDLPPWRS